ncbi:glycosyltransferase [Fulvimarina sp. MAC3]|uniref:glycosyltransferase n=1 Tax=Fulvimarina sp. MAC3 TaxID=3148887 RepID=UPI0031FCC0DA
MARIALVCPAYYSHIRAFEVLGQALEMREHEIVFILPEGAEAMVQRPGTSIVTIAASGSSPQSGRKRRDSGGAGVLGILRAVADRAAATDQFCRLAPCIFRANRIDAVLADEFEPGAGLVAAYLDLPHISFAAALPIERDVAMPLPFLDWPYDPSERGLARNRGGELVGGIFMRRQRKVIETWAERFGLEGRKDDVSCLSPTLRLAQTVEGFDFPRPRSPNLRPVGPIRSAPVTRLRGDERFPIDPKRPFVFASLGTMQGHRFDLFKAIASACRRLDLQVMIAHCGGLSARQAARLSADWVVDFADQPEMLARADICVTHGGLNTVLDCLAAGTPMLALPVGYDQPGVGARILYHGVGETIAAKRAKLGNVTEALAKLIANRAAYETHIAPIRSEIAKAGGTQTAAELVDRLLAGAERSGSRRRYAARPDVANDVALVKAGLSARL